MAQPPDKIEAQQSAFMREVEEELSYDKLMGFFRNHGRKTLVILLAGLVALAGWLWWQSHETYEAGLQGEQLSAVLDDLSSGNQTNVVTRLAPLANSGNEGYRASAKLLIASIAQEKGDLPNAIADFKAVAQDTGIAQPWRDLALVRETALEYDSLAPSEVITRLQPLAQSGKPWFGSAGEMVAMAELKEGKADQAGALFANMARDPNMPDSIAARARQMAASLGVDVPDSVTKDSSE